MTDPVMLLSQVHGEGRVTFRALRAAGFYTLAGVAEASIHLLSERAHLSVQTARRLKAGAEEMLDRGIGAPGQEEPPPPAPARARNARNPRFSQKEQVAPGSLPASISFSTGVSLEEALLLSPAWDSPSEPLFAPGPAPILTHAPAPATAPGPRFPEMAAAAEVAASLVRVPATDRAAAQPETTAAEPRTEGRPEPGKISRSPGETFWSFG